MRTYLRLPEQLDFPFGYPVRGWRIVPASASNLLSVVTTTGPVGYVTIPDGVDKRDFIRGIQDAEKYGHAIPASYWDSDNKVDVMLGFIAARRVIKAFIEQTA